jgi:putative Ca2+/H+ antiporter (TMEM165/GDT1 family)
MAAFIKALLFVVVAEMGDKTQLLAMAMASKFKVKDVMIGVFVATVLNHGLAVAFGDLIGTVVPIEYVRIIAALSFLGFGLWTIRGDSIDDKDEKASKFGPIVTVAIAFFIAELGDKTQLMTITIAAQYNNPIMILMGTTIGMLIADGIGIIGGSWLAKHVPEEYIKWGAAVVFIIFGIITLYSGVPSDLLKVYYIVPFFVLLAISIYLIGFRWKAKNAGTANQEIAASARDKE